MGRNRFSSALFGAILCTALLTTTVVAKGGAAEGKGKPTTELGNNLSVPTVMIGGGFTGVTCTEGDDLVVPDGDPLNGYEIDTAAYYYVQRLNVWQADCVTASTASATAGWGDNLTGDASLRVGSPIRVELGLFDSTGAMAMQGYTVVKLEPSLLDRESAYGTLATPILDAEDPPNIIGFAATPATFGAGAIRVYDAGVTFSIVGPNDSVPVRPGTAASAEINAGGAVVYGYNLRVTEPGDYTITYLIPNVTITGVDAGTYGPVDLDGDETADAFAVSLTIAVAGGSGGGGGGGGGWGQH